MVYTYHATAHAAHMKAHADGCMQESLLLCQQDMLQDRQDDAQGVWLVQQLAASALNVCTHSYCANSSSTLHVLDQGLSCDTRAWAGGCRAQPLCACAKQ
jgi:hypothetical protein